MNVSSASAALSPSGIQRASTLESLPARPAGVAAPHSRIGAFATRVWPRAGRGWSRRGRARARGPSPTPTPPCGIRRRPGGGVRSCLGAGATQRPRRRRRASPSPGALHVLPSSLDHCTRISGASASSIPQRSRTISSSTQASNSRTFSLRSPPLRDRSSRSPRRMRARRPRCRATAPARLPDTDVTPSNGLTHLRRAQDDHRQLPPHDVPDSAARRGRSRRARRRARGRLPHGGVVRLTAGVPAQP
jgi:hypothetical protein